MGSSIALSVLILLGAVSAQQQQTFLTDFESSVFHNLQQAGGKRIDISLGSPPGLS